MELPPTPPPNLPLESCWCWVLSAPNPGRIGGRGRGQLQLDDIPTLQLGGTTEILKGLSCACCNEPPALLGSNNTPNPSKRHSRILTAYNSKGGHLFNGTQSTDHALVLIVSKTFSRTFSRVHASPHHLPSPKPHLDWLYCLVYTVNTDSGSPR